MKTIKLITQIPGPKSLEFVARRNNALPNGSAKATEIVIDSAVGATVKDVDGNILLDFAGGIGMLNVGHSRKEVVDAVKLQLEKYIHSCNIVTTIDKYVELAELLNKLTPGNFKKKTFVANSGTEAVEAAINFAKYFTKRNAIICFEGAYHGRSTLALSLTSKYALFKKGFGSFVSDIYRLQAPNIYRKPNNFSNDEHIQYCIDRFDEALINQVDPSAVAAIIIEPVIGEGGFIQMPKLFLEKIREVCDKHGIVFIADEIQCGAGRTGKFLAIEHTGIIPDLVCMAKSIGAGFPISAVTGKAEIMDAPHPGGIGGTYGGSPIACTAAIEAVKIISSKEFLDRAIAVGNIFKNRMDEWKNKFNIIGDVRNVGAMCLVEFVKNSETKTPDPDLVLQIIKESVTNGVILIRAGLYSNCIRFLPPLTITDDELNEGLDVIENAIKKFSV